ncbi:hypothetical protein MKY95_10105 [Paenibacillus sp. FSL P4-0176]|uniref:hypothetical protein n=1 Tax=Paenibacillus sp. FSL P4-0176 TaxID=2921631 RepID=UPI0030D135E4
MATERLKALTKQGTHAVGQLNSWKVEDIANGAIVTATPIDNFTIVELGFNVEGERTCIQLSDVKNKQYLIAAPERRYLGEELNEFFNDVGERSRIVRLRDGLRYQTSAYTANTGLTEITKGNVAHFDPATKKYIVSNAASPHADYTEARIKFTVVADENDTGLDLGTENIRLEVQ